MSSDHVVLSAVEERAFSYGVFIGAPMIVAANIIFAIVVALELGSTTEDSVFYKRAMKFALSSFTFTAIAFLGIIFFCNDMFVAWDYAESASFVSMVDSIVVVTKWCAKLSLYVSFTYLLYSNGRNEALSMLNKVFIISVTVISSIFALIMIIDDALVSEKEEIALSSQEDHHLWVTLYLSTSTASVAHFAVLGLVLIDMVYCIVLLYSSVRRLKQRQNGSPQRAVKGFVLVLISSVIFWIGAGSVAAGSPWKYVLTSLDTMSDSVCLLLMFNSSSSVYQSMCKLCDNACSKMVYGSEYQAANVTDNETDNDQLL
mmetsp:Transcript_2470/g.4786  ORF Transcript_2470/g.4786 Transcript_2470/m.4786 type:complete len:315 (-) Transcript_2470:44-988(-)